MIKRNRTERGGVAIVLLVAIAVLVAMAAMALSQGAATAALTEGERYWRERARANAQSALLDADAWIQSETAPAIEDILRQMSAAKVPFNGPQLAALEFPEFRKRFPMHGAGATDDDYADVMATVTLAGAPAERSLAGVTAGGAPIRVEEYRFNVRLEAEAHSVGGAMVRYEHTSLLYVEIEIGPGA